LDAFKEIDETVGDATLKKIGESIPENADWPEQTETVVEGLDSIDEGVPRVTETGDGCRSDGDNACVYEVHW
jgi:hypothetical protein